MNVKLVSDLFTLDTDKTVNLSHFLFVTMITIQSVILDCLRFECEATRGAPIELLHVSKFQIIVDMDTGI